jgi:hypothetical protein
MTTDHDHHDIVVENRGSGLGAIALAIVVLAVLAGIWYFGFGPGQGTLGASDGGTDINVDVTLPTMEPPAS